MFGIGWTPILLRIAFLGLVLVCGLQDVKRRRVRNVWVGAFVPLWILTLLLGGRPSGSFAFLTLWVILSFAVYYCYLCGLVGAADVKVIIASSASGYLLYGLGFTWVFVMTWLFDKAWYYRYGTGRFGAGTPLVWAWTWATGVYSLYRLFRCISCVV